MTSNTRLFGSIIAFSLLTMTCQAQAACEVAPFDGHSLSLCKVWQAYQDQAIAAKSTFTPASADENDGGMFNLELSIINPTNAQTLANLPKKRSLQFRRSRF